MSALRLGSWLPWGICSLCLGCPQAICQELTPPVEAAAAPGVARPATDATDADEEELDQATTELINQAAELAQFHPNGRIRLMRRLYSLTETQVQALEALDPVWLRRELLGMARQLKLDQNLIKLGQNLFARPQLAVAANQARLALVPSPKVVESLVFAMRDHIDHHLLRDILEADQRPRLENELAAENEFRRQALAELTASLIQSHVPLDEPTRDRLIPILATDLGRNLNWEVYVANRQFLPKMSSPKLQAAVSEEQWRALETIQQLELPGAPMGWVGHMLRGMEGL